MKLLALVAAASLAALWAGLRALGGAFGYRE